MKFRKKLKDKTVLNSLRVGRKEERKEERKEKQRIFSKNVSLWF
jgi:hypothetical protein